MMKYHIEESPIIDGHSPYLRVLFEGYVDDDVVQTYLRAASFIRNANASHDDNYKTRVIVYPFPNTEMDDFKEKVNQLIQSFIQNL